jgi:hypothetical protein
MCVVLVAASLEPVRDDVAAGVNEMIGGAPAPDGLPTNANGGEGIGFPFPGVGALFCITICCEAATEDAAVAERGGTPPAAVSGAAAGWVKGWDTERNGLPVFPPPNPPNGLAEAAAGADDGGFWLGCPKGDAEAPFGAAGAGAAKADKVFCGCCCANRNWGGLEKADTAGGPVSIFFDATTNVKVCFFAQGQQSVRTVVLPLR